MTTTPECPQCQQTMHEGFIPDFSYGTGTGSVLQTLWHPGKAEDRTFLGFGTGTVKIEKTEAIKVTAFRCPDCGLLQNYAL